LARTSSAKNWNAWANISPIVVRLVVRCQRSTRAAENRAGNDHDGRVDDRTRPNIVVSHAQSSADQPNACDR